MDGYCSSIYSLFLGVGHSDLEYYIIGPGKGALPPFYAYSISAVFIKAEFWLRAAS